VSYKSVFVSIAKPRCRFRLIPGDLHAISSFRTVLSSRHASKGAEGAGGSLEPVAAWAKIGLFHMFSFSIIHVAHAFFKLFNVLFRNINEGSCPVEHT